MTESNDPQDTGVADPPGYDPPVVEDIESPDGPAVTAAGGSVG
jgi:hypothetical protein